MQHIGKKTLKLVEGERTARKKTKGFTAAFRQKDTDIVGAQNTARKKEERKRLYGSIPARRHLNSSERKELQEEKKEEKKEVIWQYSGKKTRGKSNPMTLLREGGEGGRK